MKVAPVSFTGYRIDAKKNKNVQFLYNKASEVLKQSQQTVVYKTNEITFDKMTDAMRLAFEKFRIIVDKT